MSGLAVLIEISGGVVSNSAIGTSSGSEEPEPSRFIEADQLEATETNWSVPASADGGSYHRHHPRRRHQCLPGRHLPGQPNFLTKVWSKHLSETRGILSVPHNRFGFTYGTNNNILKKALRSTLILFFFNPLLSCDGCRLSSFGIF